MSSGIPLNPIEEIFYKLPVSTDSLVSQRKKALQYLSELPYPSQSEESWRKVPIGSLNPITYLEKLQGFYPNIVQIEADTRVSIRKLNEIEGNDWKLLTARLDEIIERQKSNFFFLLNIVFNTEFFYAKLPLNSEVSGFQSIVIEFSEKSIFYSPLLILDTGKLSSVKWNITYKIPATEEISFFNSVEILDIGANSQVQCNLIEDFPDSVFHIRNILSHQKQDSRLQLGYFNLNGYRGKTFFYSRLEEKGSSVKLLGAAAPTKRELQDVEFVIEHLSGHTESDLLFRVALKDKAHHIFSGVLQIPKTSLHVIANQMNNNLMLQKTARAESMPKLEVYADDVKCSHGATMGEVSEEQMFYLTSRGISEHDARYLIVEGFLRQVLELLDQGELSDELVDRFLQKLSV